MVGAGHSWLLLLLGGVGGGEDVGDVGGEQIVHLVAQRGFEHQLGVGARVPDREVEEGWAAHPVDNVTEGQRGQQVLTLVRPSFSIYLCIYIYIAKNISCAWTKVICAAVKRSFAKDVLLIPGSPPSQGSHPPGSHGF